MRQIQIENLHKSYNYKEGIAIFKRLNLSVPQRQLLTLFGPNGCGKTTLLNIIAGLVKHDKGTVRFGGPGRKAKIGYVFQNYEQSLFPWRTNLDNITFALEIGKKKKAERIKIVADFLERLEINIPLSNYPYQISGGQKQLVAIARALIYQPEVLLMDEPFSALDYKNRLFLQDKLLDIWQKTKVTILFVSHELEEAVYLGDRTILLSSDPAAPIIKDSSIKLPRPRYQKLKEEDSFFHIFQELSATFREAVAGC